jgi:hypothetical protein
MSDLYDDDIVLWSERQAALLRRIAAGERVNNEVDWGNVAEEIEAVGRTERRACESHLVQALLHDLKAEAWPLSQEVPHWRAEARHQRGEARAAFSPSMRQRIDMERIYHRALEALPETIDGTPPLPIQSQMPTLDEMLSDSA